MEVMTHTMGNNVS